MVTDFVGFDYICSLKLKNAGVGIGRRASFRD